MYHRYHGTEELLCQRCAHGSHLLDMWATDARYYAVQTLARIVRIAVNPEERISVEYHCHTSVLHQHVKDFPHLARPTAYHHQFARRRTRMILEMRDKWRSSVFYQFDAFPMADSVKIEIRINGPLLIDAGGCTRRGEIQGLKRRRRHL